MSSSRMHDETFAVLRHIEVHGPRNKTELGKGLQQASPDLGRRLANLMMLGYLALDTTTQPALFALTGKARHKLADPEGVTRKPIPKRAVEAESNALSVAQVSRPARRAAPAAYVRTARDSSMSMNPRYYRATEFHDSTRPGAMQAFTLPSRVGDRLHYRDGTVTDLDGNPLS